MTVLRITVVGLLARQFQDLLARLNALPGLDLRLVSQDHFRRRKNLPQGYILLNNRFNCHSNEEHAFRIAPGRVHRVWGIRKTRLKIEELYRLEQAKSTS